ncbi:MAG: ABC transporter ATP-binding protein [Clostridia bacterium]|nr:ABC transporter ATP-binding protein [Clostridia bacterium]
MEIQSIIKVNNLTKDYGNNRGVFDISFEVKKGEVFGFLGPNGAGKTTAIRHILGFIKPQSGKTEVAGMDSWEQPCEIQKLLGYVPGEIAFPNNMTGWKFIKQIADMRNMKDLSPAEKLCKYFELEPKAELKRMSKGMKQKIALVIAFMHDPEILILDEPTSGLDPLMQTKFCELIEMERKKGKTILMSSHMFDEVEKTCDRVAIIKQGKIISEIKIKDIEHKTEKEFEIRFKTKEDAKKFMQEDLQFTEKNIAKNRVKVMLLDAKINEFFKLITNYEVEYIRGIPFTLEKYFMKFYKEEEKSDDKKTSI